MSQPYTEALDMQSDVSYITYATSSKKQTGYIITFTHFKEEYLLSETCKDTGSGNKYDDNSALAPLIVG